MILPVQRDMNQDISAQGLKLETGAVGVFDHLRQPRFIELTEVLLVAGHDCFTK